MCLGAQGCGHLAYALHKEDVVASVRARVKNAVFDRLPGVLRRGSSTSRRVALTFDDGPDQMTPRYLGLLDEIGVLATFFLIGERAERHPELVREYLRRGHQVASHGYDHTRFSKLTRRGLIEQCERTESALGGQLTGRPWVRPPHGTLDAPALVTLVAAGYSIAMWSVDSCDYSERDPETLADRCAPGAVRSGDVVLFHEGQDWTLAALPRIVTALHAAGLECVTMQDLFSR